MRHAKPIAFGGIILIALTALGVMLINRRPPEGLRHLTGAVLTADTDLQRQRPVAEARVYADDGAGTSAVGVTDEAGLFRLTLDPPLPPGQPITLKVEHGNYHPFEAGGLDADQLHLVRMRPLQAPAATPAESSQTAIANVRVRYTFKAETIVAIASAARTFEVVNTANVPCNNRPPCSPDRKWKAAVGGFSLDAGPTRQFRHVRLSCLAGPCPFSRVLSDDFSRGGQVIEGSVVNWADTVTYLVEAEVAQHVTSDLVRHTYPVTFERFMNFTLPPGAQGPSIEAEVDGEEIVFPLGPQLKLSWATCRLDARDDGTRLYRCELKQGFTFQA